MPRKEFESFTRLDASDVNTFLMDQTVQSFADSTARTSAITTPVEGMVTYLNDIDSLSVYNGTAFTTDRTIQVFAGTASRGSAIGTAIEGMYTHINETDSLEYYNGTAWQSVGGGGSGVLQVVSTNLTSVFSTSSATYTTVTGLTASITPSSTSSKILVLAQLSIGGQSSSSMGHWKVTRGGTDIYVGDADGNKVQNVFGGILGSNLQELLISNSIMTLDSPSSTSSLTYQVEARRGVSATNVFLNRTALDFNDNNTGRGASSITLMEVAG
jgi:hypothetical protein